MGVIESENTWISSLVLYTLQALTSAERWEKVVQVGTRYHFLSGGKRFSEQALPLLVFAQRQLLSQQEVALGEAQANLEAFVRAFAESEARKKKKKSRLVVEEVLTPEELEFRAKRASMESEVEVIRIERDRRSRDLQELQRIQDELMRTMNKAIEKNDRQLLAGVLDTLSDAENSLDQLLRRDGWIGVDVDTNSEARLNLYHPAIPTYVRLKAALARSIVETPCGKPAEIDAGGKRAMQCIKQGLKAIDHTTKSLGALRAQLLLLKGAIQKKQLFNMSTQRTDGNCSNADAHLLRAQVEDCSTTLREAIAVSIRDGPHDRELMRFALMELIDVFGEKLVADQEDEHVQAAFHYLTIAHSVRSQERTLFQTIDLHSSTVTSPDSLPGFITEAMAQQSGAMSDVGEKNGLTNAPPASSGGGKTATNPAADSTHKKPPLDGERIINFFLSVLRERQAPVGVPLIEEIASTLHKFLVQNHSTYAKVCCLADLPSVPVEDPEIQAGLVCTMWGRDIAPAFVTRDGSAPMAPVLYFTLGTTRIEARAEGDSPARRRAERFATAPFLSKRPGLQEDRVRAICKELSRLRIQMEDEDSLVIDRSSFERTFFGILHRIQELLRDPLSLKRKKSKSKPPEAAVLDAFGTTIPIACALPVVRQLEDVFNTSRSVSISDSVLCYFLRDLLDSSSDAGPTRQ
ncbi:hypothetical protein ATCC90586_001983 [Pythium insidiosum]|nr:hypothetical protein ATCC90586_001983 [Pythium insidiosum]